MKYVAVVGGVIAIVGQWYPAGAANTWYLPVVGGAIAVIGGLLK
jgi:hypothetical protein